MKIRTLNHVNSHWSDGRHLSAGEGAEIYADDADADAVAHLRHLVAVGSAEVVAESEPDVLPEPESEEPKATELNPVVEIEEVEYEDMSLAALTSLAEVRGLPKYGTKADIAERLREDDDAETGTDEE